MITFLILAAAAVVISIPPTSTPDVNRHDRSD
jgi:hypothetical protein